MNAALPMDIVAEPGPEDLVRADCYRVLARLFSAAPDAGLLSTLGSAASGADDALGRAWNDLCVMARERGLKVRPGGTAADALVDEYTALFLAIGEPRVMLYGSWYLSGSLMDYPLARLRDDLARLGFARDAEVREPEDHFAALLEVMAMLVGAGRAEQGQFFQRHLAPWYGRLCERLEREDSEFYKAVARFAHGYLDGESELLAS